MTAPCLEQVTLDQRDYPLGAPVVLTAVATDPDDHDVTVDLVVHDAGLTATVGNVVAHVHDDLVLSVHSDTAVFAPHGLNQWTAVAATAGPLAVTVTVRDSQGNETTATATATVTAPPAARPYGNVFSVQQQAGERWETAADRAVKAGATGLDIYFTPGVKPSWDSRLAGFAALRGDVPLTIQVTVRTHDDAGLRDIVAHWPKAWRLQYNIWQEVDKPANGVIGDPTKTAAYKADYHSAAAILRAAGFELPWLEFTEWSIDPGNAKRPDLTTLLPAAADYRGILWSAPSYDGRDHVDVQIKAITDWMAAHAPGKPWGCMMTCFTIPATGATDAQKQMQAAQATKYWTRTRAAGADTTGWFNWNYGGTGVNGNSRYEDNPYLAKALAAFRATA
ncbi:MAG: hypothetical protein ACJ74O_13585 [Frankiaceae bacterium]